MILTPLVRRQLVIFSALSAASIGFVGVVYGDVPGRLGMGNMKIAADFDDVSGLYPDAIVTYRGRTVGDVTSLELLDDGVRVHMDISNDFRVPTDLTVEVHSTSAIGEQYVDLVPSHDDGPYLEDGAIVAADRTSGMPQISPVLDKVNQLLASVRPGPTRRVLQGVATGFGGAGPDLSELIDASSSFMSVASSRIEQTRSLINSLQPVLATQQELAPLTESYARSIALFASELAQADPDLRGLLSSSPDLEDIVDLLREVEPTLPALIANLRTTATVANVYAPNLEQSLVTYPALLAALQSALVPRVNEGDVKLDLKATFNIPPSCTSGYLPASNRRSPSDISSRDSDGRQHCELAPSAPEGVRGLRNLPCPNSALRAPSSEACGLTFDSAVPAPVVRGEDYDDLVSLLDGSFLDNIDALLRGSATEIKEGDSWTRLVKLPLRVGQPTG